ncbi:glycosyl-4,4'-diaponeurosporenoate acyltransferase CrtO family protein [Mucilaginibacter glaciei]|uniref:Glycosyl-4,4'-diaponeurosporenoate acyltransferase n=1 Tax=Mucilaginibacter glaciei TaxID=2772109 RepID=A0A926NSF2_9SPHI|nr:hypothetical protein [Mucilaginibacter glaciei]MBD1393105.1 hypothetical protein [Mucilaginibacter glaciei]
MNQAINFFWTIICFIPVIGFWVGINDMRTCCLFIGISVVSLLLPARILQLSDKPGLYERLGVKFFRKFVQNGELVNRFIKKNAPQYALIRNKSTAANYMRTVAMYERYHLLCFVFFLLTAGYAIITTHYAMGASILGFNVIYNICPLLLQQYNRSRLLKLSR